MKTISLKKVLKEKNLNYLQCKNILTQKKVFDNEIKNINAEQVKEREKSFMALFPSKRTTPITYREKKSKNINSCDHSRKTEDYQAKFIIRKSQGKKKAEELETSPSNHKIIESTKIDLLP